MSTAETTFSLYGEPNDNDLVMEALGRNPATDVYRVMGGQIIGYTIEQYKQEFQRLPRLLLSEATPPLDTVPPARAA